MRPNSQRSVLLLLAFLSFIKVHDAFACQKIRMGGLDWDSSRFHEEVVKIVLKHGYGCEVESIPGSTLPLLSALSTGDIQILMEVWKTNFKDAWGKMERAGKVESVGVTFPDAVQGWYVPRYLVEGEGALAPGLKHVKQLPKYKQLFTDPEKPSKGRFLNCILGWSCEDINTKKLYAYGLDKHFTNFRPGTGAAMAAEIASNYEQRKAFVAYYWGPTWILGKYDLKRLEEPAFDEKIWKKLIASKRPRRATAYPIVKVHIGVNTKLRQTHPQIVDFLSKYRTTNALVSQALSYVQAKKGRTPKDAALNFLKTQENLWRGWVSDEVYTNITRALEVRGQAKKRWKINISGFINAQVKWLVVNFGASFKQLGRPVLTLILKIESLFLFVPWWLFIFLAGLLTYLCTWKKRLCVVVILSLLFIYSLDIWNLSMQTLALMLISTFLSTALGLPIGILSSKYNRFRAFLLPVLDTMQTMPSFVYLIPALMLFGLGKVPAVFATVIYAIVPMIRLTDLGIRSVEPSVIEAAQSFGANSWQLLFEVKLPLAIRSIMAGINQTTMLALSMVVIASMIGARGLGEQVLLGIQKLDVGQGLTAGIGIVLLAIILDRLTQGLGALLDKTR